MSNALLDKNQEQAAFIDALGKKATGLLADVDGLRDKARLETRALTAEEHQTITAKLTEVESINQTLELEKRRMATNVYTDQPNLASARLETSGHIEVRDLVIDKPWGYEARGAETPTQRRERLSHGFGEYLTSVKNAALSRSTGTPVDPRLLALTEFEKRAAAGASEAVPSDGSFLIYPDFAQEVLMLSHETGLVYPRARMLPLSEYTNAIKIPAVDEQSRKDGFRRGGIQMFWENEAASLVGSKPTYALIELVLKKLTGLYYATSEVLADARLLGAMTMQFMGEEYGFKLDDGVIRGTGAGQLKGVLNSPALITVAKETGQGAATVDYKNIQKMWARMYAPLRRNAVWFINQDVEPQLMGLSIVIGVGGLPVYLPPGGATAVPYAQLFGRPVITIEHASTVGTPGDIILGDFSQYFMCDKGPLQQAVSMHVRFLTDEMTYRFIYRVDGQPWWKTTLQAYQGTNTYSPWVVLAAR